MKKIRSNNRTIVIKKTKLLSRIIVFFVIILAAASVLFILTFLFPKSKSFKLDESALIELWDRSEYQQVYEQSSLLLEQHNFNSTALLYKGLSSFYVALAQTDTASEQTYLDESINNLRKSLYFAHDQLKPQIYYILGKAYFQKNLFSSYHYYSDLAIKYLEKALEAGYNSSDIPEYLGLSYANIGLTQQSIQAFTNALLVRESDVLLLAIAQQYMLHSNLDIAKQYLFKVAQESNNDILILKSKIVLAQIYIDEQKYDEAAAEYLEILEKDPEYADAYYGLGLVYEKQGDSAKARAEWRKVIKIQVNHQGAIKKLGL